MTGFSKAMLQPKTTCAFICLSIVNAFILAESSFAQSESSFSQSQTPAFPEPIRPARTFGGFQPQPRTFSPPLYNYQRSGQFNQYHLSIGDAIILNVQGFPEFNFTGSINPEGEIVVPILGRVLVLGLTLEEVETKIALELNRRFLTVVPPVNAVLVGARPIAITILGEIVKPGFYTLPPGGEITNLLTLAGGTTDRADLREVIVRRSLIDGSVIEQKLDLYTPLQNGESLPKLVLQGGDVVILSKLEVGEEGYDRVLVSRSTLAQQTITVRVVAPTEEREALRNITLPNGSTFFDVIALIPAGNFITIDSRRVALLRFDRERGKVVSQILNANTALRGDFSQNIPLQNDDVVIVSRTLIGKIFNGIAVIAEQIQSIADFRAAIEDIFNLERNRNDSSGRNNTIRVTN